jgi:hypothetical protein
MSADSQNDQGWSPVPFDGRQPSDPFFASIEERLTEFRKHKETLLSHLQKAYERGSKTEPFDKDKLWSELETVARVQHTVEKITRETMDAAERKARLRKLADVLTRARSTLEDAMRSPDLTVDLIDSWEGPTEYVEAGGDLVYIDIEGEIEKVMKGLAALEKAAAQAVSGTQRNPGRPRGSSVLSPAYIRPLADLYRKCTGLKPGAGQGPFARFVGEYLIAIGLGLIGEDRLVDIIKRMFAPAR